VIYWVAQNELDRNGFHVISHEDFEFNENQSKLQLLLFETRNVFEVVKRRTILWKPSGATTVAIRWKNERSIIGGSVPLASITVHFNRKG